MNRQSHPSWEEKLMPYADEQLQADDAALVAAHLEGCSECARAVSDSKRLSMQMTNWEVEEAPGPLRVSVLAELESKVKPRRAVATPRTGWWTGGRVLVYSLSGTLAVLALVVLVSAPSLLRSRQATPDLVAKVMSSPLDTASARREESISIGAPQQGQGQGQGQMAGQGQGQGRGQQSALFRQSDQQQTGTSSDAPAGPMIIRTVQLTLISKEFDAARARIETIVREARGYVDQLSVRSNPGSAKGLSAVLRFPSDRLDASLVELRRLGQAKQESQNSSDITGQYADLVARLNNARNTEQRLITLLRERTGRLQDVIEAEREVARVREDVERMEAEQKNLNNRVQYSTVQVELTEEYRAQLEPSAPSAGTRLRNAAVEGYGFAIETVLGIVLALLTYSPTMLVLGVLLAPLAFLTWQLRSRLGSSR